MSTVHEHASYRAVATARAQRFLETRNREAAQWRRRHPEKSFPAAAIRLTIVPPRCDCGFCNLDLLLSDRADPCVFEVWTRAMEAAGLPPRPYVGERDYLAHLVRERAAGAERDRLERRRLELVARLVAPYPDGEVWQVSWVNVPSKQVAAFWDAEREGTAEAWLNARDAALIRLDESAEAGGSNKVLLPEERGEEQRLPLRRRRPQKRKRSGLHPSPVPRESLDKGRYAKAVYTWFTRIGHPIIDAVVAETGEKPTIEALADLLFARMESSGSAKYVQSEEWGLPSHVVTWTTVLIKAQQASEFLLQEWQETYRAEQAIRGAAGGRKSKRPKDVTVEMLLAVRAAHGRAVLTREQEAVLLGCSVETIKRRRRELAHRGSDKVMGKKKTWVPDSPPLVSGLFITIKPVSEQRPDLRELELRQSRG